MASLLLSRHDLVPNLGVLDRLILERSPEQSRSAVDRETEQLPYYLRGACAALYQLEAARREAVTEAFAIPGIGPHTQYVLDADKVDPLSFAIDFYLFCLRRVFDALVPYLRRCPENPDLPRSFSKLYKGIRKNKHSSLDLQIQEIIREFWDDVGETITGYRDQANHRAIILSNCVAFKGDGGIVGLKMLLPDNPLETSPSELRYEPGIPVMGFALDSLGKTVRFANLLVERMIDLMAPGDPNVRSTGVVSIAMRGAPVQFGPKISGEPVPFPVDVGESVVRAVRATQNP